MRAVVQERYGALDDLVVRDLDPPRVHDDEVLLRVRATSVHPDVWHVVQGAPAVLRVMGAGLRRPKEPVPGTDAAGRVEAVGRDVTRFRPGDEVFGETMAGHSWRNAGAFAELVSAPEGALATKPANVTFEQAAAVPTSGLIAVRSVRAAGVRAGREVLVNGAAGGVGATVVQIARSLGARVTGVDAATKLDLIRSLGADEVVAHEHEDFTRRGRVYDAIVDIPGNHPFAACRRALRDDGRYVLVGHDRFGAGGHRLLGSLPRFMRLVAMTPFVRQLRAAEPMPSKQAAMVYLAGLLEAGELTPVVDRTFPLDEVSAAIRHLVDGRARGKVLLTV